MKDQNKWEHIIASKTIFYDGFYGEIVYYFDDGSSETIETDDWDEIYNSMHLDYDGGYYVDEP